jgi:transcriptional regulator with XRE-family HTH domain
MIINTQNTHFQADLDYQKRENNMDFKAIGKRIRQVRNSHGLKQDEFAEKIGVNRHSLSRIESGKQQPPLDILGALWSVYKVDANWLINGVESSPVDNVDVQKLESDLAKSEQSLAETREIIQLLKKTAGLI